MWRTLRRYGSMYVPDNNTRRMWTSIRSAAGALTLALHTSEPSAASFRGEERVIKRELRFPIFSGAVLFLRYLVDEAGWVGSMTLKHK